jgi:hypothetical protein
VSQGISAIRKRIETRMVATQRMILIWEKYTGENRFGLAPR